MCCLAGDLIISKVLEKDHWFDTVRNCKVAALTKTMAASMIPDTFFANITLGFSLIIAYFIRIINYELFKYSKDTYAYLESFLKTINLESDLKSDDYFDVHKK